MNNKNGNAKPKNANNEKVFGFTICANAEHINEKAQIILNVNTNRWTKNMMFLRPFNKKVTICFICKL